MTSDGCFLSGLDCLMYTGSGVRKSQKTFFLSSNTPRKKPVFFSYFCHSLKQKSKYKREIGVDIEKG